MLWRGLRRRTNSLVIAGIRLDRWGNANLAGSRSQVEEKSPLLLWSGLFCHTKGLETPSVAGRGNVGFVLEGKPAFQRRVPGRAEITYEDQVLQVVGETLRGVRKSSVVGFSLERVAILHDSARRIVVGEWVKQPLAKLVGKGVSVLGKMPGVDRGGEGIGLTTRLAAVGAVIAAEGAATAAAQVSFIGDEERQRIRVNL